MIVDRTYTICIPRKSLFATRTERARYLAVRGGICHGGGSRPLRVGDTRRLPSFACDLFTNIVQCGRPIASTNLFFFFATTDFLQKKIIMLFVCLFLRGVLKTKVKIV